MKDTFFVCLLWNRLNFIFPPHLIKQKIKIILKCYAKQWGEAVTGHSLQLFELLLTPFLVTVFLQVHRDNELWYLWTKSQINPRKKNNYLTVSQEEVMDKVAEMYNTNNSFFVYVFAASWPDRKLTFWSDTANTTKLICVRSLPSLFLWWHRHCSYEVDYEDCGPDFRLSFMILVTFGFLHLVPSSGYSSRY